MKLVLELDRKGLKFAGAFAILLGVVFFVAAVAGRQLGALAFPLQETRYAAIVTAHKTPGPVFKELADDAVVFSSSNSVLDEKDQLEKERRDFIFADLGEMKLSLYQKGDIIKTFDIQGRGREGSFFETPNGSYKIRLKEKNHFSTIGKVWMPWSMHFYGNYFIHGIPYYPNGTYVSDAFSGGCIRLSVTDSKELFALTKEGTTVLTYTKEPEHDLDFEYFEKITKAPAPPPRVSAVAVLAADFETGQILFEKDRTKQFPIASVSKLMTGLVALETINRFKVLEISKEAILTEGDSAHLSAGDKYKVEELLYPLILSSSNDVAMLYQQQVWNFIGTMNEKAKAIGMSSTHYEEASGLDPGNVSTPEDLFKLLRFIYVHKKPLFALSGLDDYTLSTADKEKKTSLVNVNWPHGDDRFIGGKSGATPEAHQAMAAVYKVKLSEYGDRPIAIIVLGSDNRVEDVRRVTKYLEDNFVYGSVIAKDKTGNPIVNAGANMYSAISSMLK